MTKLTHMVIGRVFLLLTLALSWPVGVGHASAHGSNGVSADMTEHDAEGGCEPCDDGSAAGCFAACAASVFIASEAGAGAPAPSAGDRTPAPVSVAHSRAPPPEPFPPRQSA